MSETANNQQTVETLFYEGWNKHNVDAVDNLFATRFTIYFSHQSVSDLKEFKKVMQEWLTGIPDLTYTLEDTILEKNKVVVRWIGKGTHKNKFLEIPPAGKTFLYRGISIFEFTPDNKIEKAWVYSDLSDSLNDLK